MKRRKRGKRAKPAEPARSSASIAPHLIAAFVLFHVAASCLSVIPDLGPAMDRRAWRDARVERELAVWGDRLSVPADELEDRLYDTAVSLHEARSALLAPFDPYLRVSGVQQNWPMFSAGTEASDRFGVKLR